MAKHRKHRIRALHRRRWSAELFRTPATRIRFARRQVAAIGARSQRKIRRIRRAAPSRHHSRLTIKRLLPDAVIVRTRFRRAFDVKTRLVLRAAQEVAAVEASRIFSKARRAIRAVFVDAPVSSALVDQRAGSADETIHEVISRVGAFFADVERSHTLCFRACSRALVHAAAAEVEAAALAVVLVRLDVPFIEAEVGLLGGGVAAVEGIVEAAFGLVRELDAEGARGEGIRSERVRTYFFFFSE